MLVNDEHFAYPPSNFSWIIERELAAMAWPRTTANIRFLQNQRIKHLVNLSPEMRPSNPIQGIEWTEILIEEFCPPSVEQMIKFIKVCEHCRRKNEPLGVHCRMGRGRTGVMAACFLVHFYNQSPEQAITNVRLMRPGSVETCEQEKAVVEYSDYLQSMI